jgi:uncharacterized protein (TIGR02594 family)
MINTSAFLIAQRFIGTKETAGAMSNPLILAMLQLDTNWPKDEGVAWCSAFINFITWIVRLPRSKSLAARSWLQVGIPVPFENAVADSDVVIISRGIGKQPGPEVINAPGHVGFFAGWSQDKKQILLLGGNQSDGVTLAPFPRERILGIRRLS